MRPLKFLLTALTLFACMHCYAQSNKPEVIYHIFQRSFYDSNGDQHGDLNGIRQKLDYLQDLGITSILLTPLYESVYYHNYFPINFEKIDPRYGTMQDYLALIKDLHRRGMKFYMDMETQYVTEDHLWWKDSFGNPSSRYSDYILYQDKEQRKPSTIVFDLTELKGYDGVTRKITTVNLNSPKVKEYNYRFFKHWVDPNNDGRFDDGVDGFRLDHMMDNLDNKKELTGLFKSFWSPLLGQLRAVNPALKIVAEQANWASFGQDYIEQGGVDRVFAFRLAVAIRDMDKSKIAIAADTTFLHTGATKQQVVFIENHDIPRFSYVVKRDPAKERAGCALNLLLGGIPSIYYGQELGMTGAGGFGKYGANDANEIPDREAFEWNASGTGKGMALWYKGTGPWWDSTNVKANDGISLQEQRSKPASLWNFYKNMIALRKGNTALANGDYKALKNDNNKVLTFLRIDGNKQVLVAVNLSPAGQELKLSLETTAVNNIWGGATLKPAIQLTPYDVQVWQLN